MVTEDSSPAVSQDAAIKKGWLGRFLGTYEIGIIGLIVRSIIGIGITDFSPADSYKYWVAMVPIFCGASLILEGRYRLHICFNLKSPHRINDALKSSSNGIDHCRKN